MKSLWIEGLALVGAAVIWPIYIVAGQRSCPAAEALSREMAPLGAITIAVFVELFLRVPRLCGFQPAKPTSWQVAAWGGTMMTLVITVFASIIAYKARAGVGPPAAAALLLGIPSMFAVWMADRESERSAPGDADSPLHAEDGVDRPRL